MRLNRKTLIQMYKRMLEIRLFEEKIAELYAKGTVPGPAHLYIGEEAVAVGACMNLREDSYVTSTHRGHGHMIATGAQLDRILAEILGKSTGYCKGLSGSMHLAKFDKGIFMANSIVGAGIPIAAGMGLSIKMRGTDQVCVCFFGDGATNTGAFHEGMNLAAVWKLPVIFICENNLYALSTHLSKQTAAKNLAEKAKAYGMSSVTVDGNNVIAVFNTVKRAVKRANSRMGPTFIECRTYRFRGHYEGDPQEYRSKEEIKKWMERDSLLILKTKLVKMGLERKVEEVEREVRKEVADAEKFALESPTPSPEEVVESIYA